MSEKITDPAVQNDEVTKAGATPSPLVEVDESDPIPDLSDADFKTLYSAVEQMANLLSDPGSLRNSIGEKVAKKALPEEWTDIARGLPEKPLLQRVGEQWHWLFDINANPLQPQDATTTAGAKAAVMQPVPPHQGQVAYVEALIKEVDKVIAAIRLFTEERLTTDELEKNLRLLPTAPTYNSFQSCAGNYRANAGTGPTEQTYTSLTSDKSVIEEYATKLQELVKAIKRTIFLAEFLGYEKLACAGPPGPSPKPPTTRLRSEMMRLLATDLDFFRFTAPQIVSMLAEFKNEFELNEKEISEEFEKIEHDDLPLDDTWISGLQSRLNELYLRAGSPPAVSPGEQNWIDLYFLNRANALILHLRNKQNLKRFSLRDLRVLVCSILPSPQGQPMEVPAIHGNPDNSPLHDYADALAATSAYLGGPTLFLAFALLVKLGFGKQVEAFVSEAAGLLGEDPTADLLDAARANRCAGERVVLILGGQPEQRIAVGNVNLVRTRRGEGSYAANWTLSKTHAVFPIHAGDLGAFGRPFQNLKNSLVSGLEISIEIQDEGVSGSLASQGLRGLLGSLAVGKPATLDDAVAMIKKIYPTSA